MRTTCSIKDCPSQDVGREYRNKLDLPSTQRLFTLFSVPKKDLELRKKWSKIMNYDFQDKDKICEFHFPEEAINRDHEIHLPDGVHKIPLSRISLKAGAVPENKRIILEPVYDESELKVVAKNTFIANFNEICQRNKENILASLNNDHGYAQRQPEVQVQVDRSIRKDYRRASSGVSTALEILTSELEVETYNPNYDEFIKEKLPGLWRWSKINDDVLIAATYDPVTFLQKKSMIIKKNLPEHKMEVQAIIDGHVVNLPELEATEDLKGILNNIDKLSTLLVCNGISETFERSKDCLRFVRPRPHGNVYGRTRCKNCDALRKKRGRDQVITEKKNEKFRKLKLMIKKLETEKLKLQGNVNKLEAKLNYYSKQANLQKKI